VRAQGDNAFGSPRPLIGRRHAAVREPAFVRGAAIHRDISVPDQAYAVLCARCTAHARISRSHVGGAPGARCAGRPRRRGLRRRRSHRHGASSQSRDANDVRLFDLRIHARATRSSIQLQLPLAVGDVRFVGEAVARWWCGKLDGRAQAAEAVAVEYEVLPAVTDVMDAFAKGAHDDLAGGAAIRPRLVPSRPRAVETAIKKMASRRRGDGSGQRTSWRHGARAAIGSYDAVAAIYLISGCPGRASAAACAPGCLKVRRSGARDSAGCRRRPSPRASYLSEQARVVGRHAAWDAREMDGHRSEAFLTITLPRDVVTRARLAFNRRADAGAGRSSYRNAGAHTISYVPLSNGYRGRRPSTSVPTPGCAERGDDQHGATAPSAAAGPPPSATVMERLSNCRKTVADRRGRSCTRRNLIRRDKLPLARQPGSPMTAGISRQPRPRARSRGLEGLSASPQGAKKRRRLLGIGLANYVETPGGCPRACRPLSVARQPHCAQFVGTQSSGQGHETSFARWGGSGWRRIGGDRFVSRRQPPALASGGGTRFRRSMRLAGSLMVESSRAVTTSAPHRRPSCSRLPRRSSFADGLFMATETAIGVHPVRYRPAPRGTSPRLRTSARAAGRGELYRRSRYPTGAASAGRRSIRTPAPSKSAL